MSTTILARELTPGDIYKSRTPFGVATYMVTDVDAGPNAVVVHSLREYKGQVANWDRVYAADECITFRDA